MEKPITLTVLSTDTRAEIRDTITAGDSDAYPLSITFSDLTAITGTVRFRFVRGDDYWDRDATVAGNVASLMLEPAFYAATGTELWVSFEDANLYTPLHVYFRDIRVPGGNIEVETSQTYPAWVAEVQEAEEQREEAYTVAEQGRDDSYAAQEIVRDGLYASAESARDDLYDAQEIVRDGLYASAESDRMDAEVLRKSAETDRVTAEANRAVWEEFDPLDVYAVGNKVYYLGSSYIMHTVSGVAGTLPTDTDYWAIIVQKGDTGEMTIGNVTTLAPGEPATVTNSGTSTDAVLNLGIPAGYDGSAVPIDDASTAADRVLSASYVKGQLSAKADKAQESWITPTLVNSWVNETGQVTRYMKDSMGFVHAEVFIKNGAATFQKVFDFIPGYRPDQIIYVVGVSGFNHAAAYITTAGSFDFAAGTLSANNRFIFSFKAV